MLESKIEQYLKNQISKIGGLCWKFESPGTSGVPDRIIILPGNIVAFAELKAPGQAERPQQVYRQRQLRQMGCTVFSSVDSFAEVDQIVEVMKNQLSTP